MPALPSLPALVVLTAWASAACGGGLRSVAAESPLAPIDPALVLLVEGPTPPDAHLVNFAAWDASVHEPLPASPPADVLTALRDNAAALGASRLYLDRLDAEHRKAFFAAGVAPASAQPAPAPTPCAHASFAAAAQAVRAEASRCLAAVKRRRPALTGLVAFVFQVDPWGQLMHAAPSPRASRDDEARACLYSALAEAEFGTTPRFTCAAEIEVPIDAAEP